MRADLEPLLVDGLVATCAILDREMGFSAEATASVATSGANGGRCLAREDR